MAKVIERNYHTNPHTASFLQKFHSAAQGLPAEIEVDENAAELALARLERTIENTSAQDHLDDLLAEVPVEAPIADMRSTRQKEFIDILIGDIEQISPELAAQAREYTARMTAHGAWTGGLEGNASRWIGRLAAKRDDLRSGIAKTPESKRIPLPEVPDGRYAVENNGVLKFYRVKRGTGQWAHRVFVDVQASGDFYPVRDSERITVMLLIAGDPKGAAIRYGRELGVCSVCGRTLTDENSRAAGIGPQCRGRMDW
jgi:hypothetical protein